MLEFARVRVQLNWPRAIEDCSAQPLEAEGAAHGIVSDIPRAIVFLGMHAVNIPAEFSSNCVTWFNLEPCPHRRGEDLVVAYAIP